LIFYCSSQCPKPRINNLSRQFFASCSWNDSEKGRRAEKGKKNQEENGKEEKRSRGSLFSTIKFSGTIYQTLKKNAGSFESPDSSFLLFFDV
jgi:hypothetical protein